MIYCTEDRFYNIQDILLSVLYHDEKIPVYFSDKSTNIIWLNPTPWSCQNSADFTHWSCAPLISCDKRPFCQLLPCCTSNIILWFSSSPFNNGIQGIRYSAQTLHGMRDENWSERSSLSFWMIDIMTWKNIYRLIFVNGSTLRAKDLYKVSPPPPKKKNLNR